MLGLAWLLGCLFWYVYTNTAIKSREKELKSQLKTWQKNAKTLEEELSTVNFDWETANTELNSLRNNYTELEIRYKALEEFKGTSANTFYEPVPPPNSLVKSMEDEDKAEKRFVYFSPDETNKKVTKSTRKKIIKAKRTTQKEANYNNAFSPNDLTIFEGIGSKVEKLLKENGISTWTRLAVTSFSDLRLLLSKEGSKYQGHDPSSWSQQASLARVGQWDDLILFQKGLSSSNKSKVKKLYKKNKGTEAYRVDDLQIIVGVDPKIEQLLKDGGIDNWSKLAAATKADIKQIMSIEGDRFLQTDFGAWIKQADLANKGEISALKAYQKQLKGSKEM